MNATGAGEEIVDLNETETGIEEEIQLDNQETVHTPAPTDKTEPRLQADLPSGSENKPHAEEAVFANEMEPHTLSSANKQPSSKEAVTAEPQTSANVEPVDESESKSPYSSGGMLPRKRKREEMENWSENLEEEEEEEVETISVDNTPLPKRRKQDPLLTASEEKAVIIISPDAQGKDLQQTTPHVEGGLFTGAKFTSSSKEEELLDVSGPAQPLSPATLGDDINEIDLTEDHTAQDKAIDIISPNSEDKTHNSYDFDESEMEDDSNTDDNDDDDDEENPDSLVEFMQDSNQADHLQTEESGEQNDDLEENTEDLTED
ncbi:hypothetical protein RFI_01279 [Reticulomyxa filosa]|uniref:Uncharacterized protein n=1 Tax=Reticulomyxa filosa TaxID=46433 RepID=X6PCF5_RETFI|nr:hypothetical protein RFI_01279 [Reticulomyxa filosa]|eukprot:ETO35783.1 hypothetical protein RFI_01279 [Reticulomyxa filosa]